jgi:hypothetical protein
MTDLKENYDHLLRLWTNQESLLQSYRGIFVAAQSILIGFAFVVSTRSREETAAFVGLVALGLFIQAMWIWVCRSRALSVTFCQWRIHKLEQSTPEVTPRPLAALKEFQAQGTFNGRPASADPLFREAAQSVTRRQMDVWLPNAFALLWFILAAVAVGRSFNFWVAASAFLWLVLAAYVLRPLDRVSRA